MRLPISLPVQLYAYLLLFHLLVKHLRLFCCFNNSSVILSPRDGCSLGTYGMKVGIKKLESQGYLMVKIACSYRDSL